MPELLEAIDLGDQKKTDEMMRLISIDGWKAHLRSVTIMDTRAMFAYLVRAEG